MVVRKSLISDVEPFSTFDPLDLRITVEEDTFTSVLLGVEDGVDLRIWDIRHRLTTNFGMSLLVYSVGEPYVKILSRCCGNLVRERWGVEKRGNTGIPFLDGYECVECKVRISDELGGISAPRFSALEKYGFATVLERVSDVVMANVSEILDIYAAPMVYNDLMRKFTQLSGLFRDGSDPLLNRELALKLSD